MSLVRLIDGREVSSSSEDWRAECEARWLLSLPSKGKRYEFIEKVADFRGELAAQELKMHALRIHEHKQKARKQK